MHSDSCLRFVSDESFGSNFFLARPHRDKETNTSIGLLVQTYALLGSVGGFIGIDFKMETSNINSS